MTLVLSMGGRIHRDDCIRARRAYKTYTFIGEDTDVGAFIRAHKLLPCLSCFSELRDA